MPLPPAGPSDPAFPRGSAEYFARYNVFASRLPSRLRPARPHKLGHKRARAGPGPAACALGDVARGKGHGTRGREADVLRGEERQAAVVGAGLDGCGGAGVRVAAGGRGAAAAGWAVGAGAEARPPPPRTRGADRVDRVGSGDQGGRVRGEVAYRLPAGAAAVTSERARGAVCGAVRRGCRTASARRVRHGVLAVLKAALAMDGVLPGMQLRGSAGPAAPRQRRPSSSEAAQAQQLREQQRGWSLGGRVA
jgi:hypothetical protein